MASNYDAEESSACPVRFRAPATGFRFGDPQEDSSIVLVEMDICFVHGLTPLI